MRDLGWIGVDLDGTLAYFDFEAWCKNKYHIGPPVRPMLNRVKDWLSQGRKVKIFTARYVHGPAMLIAIRIWLTKVGLPELEITNVKDFWMDELWDDRCIQVEHNTGRRIGSQDVIVEDEPPELAPKE